MIRLLLFLIPLSCFGQTGQIVYPTSESRLVSVPNVQGMLYPAAVEALARVGLNARPGGQMGSDRPPRTVIAQDHAPQTMLPRGAAVYLTVSTDQASLRMPNLVGLNYAQADSVVEKIKLALRTAGTAPSSQPAGTVLAQTPAANEALPASRIVTVTVAIAQPTRFVPYVVGMTMEAASRTLRSVGLTTGEPTRTPSNTPVGIVVEQYPAGGQAAKPGEPVDLTISEGPAQSASPQSVRVPDLRRQTVDQARQTLARSRLNLGQTAAVLDPSPAGTIFAQNPSPGAPAPPDSPVNVSVSTGGIVVPDLTGDSQPGAQQALSNARLREGAIQTTESPEPAGEVIQQSPRGGALALPGSPVSLVLSAGTPQPARVRVPNLAGLSLQAASETLETSDLRVGTLQRQESSEPPGTIFDQSPAAETLVAPGRSVELFVSEPAAAENPVLVPDVSGLSLSKARSLLAGATLRSTVMTQSMAGDDGALVARQDPSPDQSVQPNTQVQLWLQPASRLPWVIGGTGAVLGGALVFGFLRLRPKPIHAKPTDPSRVQYVFHRDWGAVRLRMSRPQPADQALRFTASRGHSRQTIVERSSRKG